MEVQLSETITLMSSDTEIWTKRTGPLSELALGEEWRDEGDALVREGSGWVVNLFESREVDASGAPRDLLEVEPELHYCVEVSLEPAGAPPEGLATLESVVERVGSKWGGATLDPTSGHVRAWP